MVSRRVVRSATMRTVGSPIRIVSSSKASTTGEVTVRAMRISFSTSETRACSPSRRSRSAASKGEDTMMLRSRPPPLMTAVPESRSAPPPLVVTPLLVRFRLPSAGPAQVTLLPSGQLSRRPEAGVIDAPIESSRISRGGSVTSPSSTSKIPGMVKEILGAPT